MIRPSATHLRRPRPLAFVVALLVVAAGISAVAVTLRRGPIERDLASRAAAAVHGVGASQIQVTAQGTQITLHGDFASPAAAAAALRAARVDGVSSAQLAGDALVATLPAVPVVLSSRDGALTVAATVPDRAARAGLLGDLSDATGGQLTSQITVDPRAAAPALPALAGLVTALTQAPGSHSLTVDGGHLLLAGTVTDDVARARLATAVVAAARASDTPVALDDRLVVVPTAPEPPAAPAGDARAALAAATAGHTVTFSLDSAALSPVDEANLAAVAAALRPGTLTVLVAGHTDSTGPAGYNEALSLRRARAAVAYLESAGVPADRLRCVGDGEADPVADNATAVGRAANRRVEITSLPGA
jgi:OOP family OmpA-OmpF porin